MGRIAIRLKSSNKGAQPRSQNDKVTRSRSSLIGVRFPRRNKNGPSWARHLRSVMVAEMQFSFQYMPRFVVRVVDMQGGSSTAAPFMQTERGAGCGKGLRLHASILP